jgi:hypothetical protein
MRRTNILIRFGLALIVCLGTLTAVSPASARGNRCSDRCADRYRFRKDACKSIPFKNARHGCENAAKRAKDECKRRCR